MIRSRCQQPPLFAGRNRTLHPRTSSFRPEAVARCPRLVVGKLTLELGDEAGPFMQSPELPLAWRDAISDTRPAGRTASGTGDASEHEAQPVRRAPTSWQAWRRSTRRLERSTRPQNKSDGCSRCPRGLQRRSSASSATRCSIRCARIRASRNSSRIAKWRRRRSSLEQAFLPCRTQRTFRKRAVANGSKESIAACHSGKFS